MRLIAILTIKNRCEVLFPIYLVSIIIEYQVWHVRVWLRQHCYGIPYR